MRQPLRLPLAVLTSLTVAVACGEVTTVHDQVSGPVAKQPSPTTAARDDRPGARDVEPPELAGITAAHNRVRATVGVPPLRWSATLAATARQWANACVDAKAPRGMIDHSPERPGGYATAVGENIFATTAPRADPLVAVSEWAGERVYYDHERNACSGGMCGHYTQLVWGASREVGCGVGSCPGLRFRTTLVCQYAPVGNVVGERPY
jgi:pathogenesis-related protein 1